MRTRQTTRKQINLPGRYQTGLGEPQDVILRDLSVGGCRFETGGRKFAPGAPLQILVAGTGPHSAIVKWIDSGEVGLNFTVPLGEDQFESFKSSHVPDPEENNLKAQFKDIGDIRPQRFC